MKMKNETYDLLKKLALMIMPLITFVAALGDIWGIPHVTEITATLAALDTLIGAILHVSSANYWKKGDDDELSE